MTTWIQSSRAATGTSKLLKFGLLMWEPGLEWLYLQSGNIFQKEAGLK